MLLIQAGGLGYMTIATLVAVVLGKRITLQERTTLQEALNLYTREGLLRFAMNVVRMTAPDRADGGGAAGGPLGSGVRARAGGLPGALPRGVGVQQRRVQPLL